MIRLAEQLNWIRNSLDGFGKESIENEIRIEKVQME